MLPPPNPLFNFSLFTPLSFARHSNSYIKHFTLISCCILFKHYSYYLLQTHFLISHFSLHTPLSTLHTISNSTLFLAPFSASLVHHHQKANQLKIIQPFDSSVNKAHFLTIKKAQYIIFVFYFYNRFNSIIKQS